MSVRSVSGLPLMISEKAIHRWYICNGIRSMSSRLTASSRRISQTMPRHRQSSKVFSIWQRNLTYPSSPKASRHCASSRRSGRSTVRTSKDICSANRSLPAVMESFLLREVLYPIEACSLAADSVPSFSVQGKIKMLKHQNQALDLGFSDIKAHRTSTRFLYFTTDTPLPLQSATFEVRLFEGIQLVSCTLTVTAIEHGQYVGEYTTTQEAELVLRFFQSLRYKE